MKQPMPNTPTEDQKMTFAAENKSKTLDTILELMFLWPAKTKAIIIRPKKMKKDPRIDIIRKFAQEFTTQHLGSILIDHDDDSIIPAPSV